MKVLHIPTRYALIKRAEKLVAQIEEYFGDMALAGVSVDEADPEKILRKMYKSFTEMLARERVKNG